MAENNAMLPAGLLLLGIAGIAGFMAFRPWPVDPASTTNPKGALSPRVYAVEIITGKPPAASLPPDRGGDIALIEGGLAALLGVWITAKLASALSGLTNAGGGGAAGNTKEPTSSEEDLGSEIEGDIKSALPDVADLEG